MTAIERIQSTGPKKILALDGGGIRGMIAVEVLGAIENLPREMLKSRSGRERGPLPEILA